ncbi:MADS-box SVP-like [Olea europaea subsp. europaea]|uniref:MADS-box SVP-like n=1 Tax=Olea europaea subsp. europaea TaxID=158383 RepID=A0A8S0UWR2_OLEEU|nr:MADS-box SVP-like [Olea europaea subsp. europaea]
MAREKSQIKKIVNASALQVTFSKKRRGIFKKAKDLSVHCDADVALIIFSFTEKLFEFASSSVVDTMGDRTLAHRVGSHLNLKSDRPILCVRNHACYGTVARSTNKFVVEE